MFVVFEGIDGGGKTTLSNLVATRLRHGGLRVEHVREGGRFASSVTQAMRELGRDARNVALSPRAELMLYLTREVQLFDEATRPALGRADVVIADRFVATAEALAVYGRQLPEAEVAPLVIAATGGLRPDLTVLVDVDPRVARARRQVAKLLAADDKPPSRKGLAGQALQYRLREGYRALAAREPDRWIVVDNTDADLETLADLLVGVVRTARERGVSMARETLPTMASPAPTCAADPASAKVALLAWIDRRAEREPALAAYFLGSVPGPEFDERRRALATRAPVIVAAGLKWLDDRVSWELRHELAAVAPAEVARSIVGDAANHPDAAALLGALSVAAPMGVGEALWGRDDAVAWELRERLPADAVMVSLGAVHAAHAWSARDAWLADHAGRLAEVAVATLACRSVDGVADARAWELRKTLRGTAPVAALEATIGLVDERSWRWRERLLERAPKTVMKTLIGMDDPRAWELRARVATSCEEALDSTVALDSAHAWALRDQLLDLWPATAVRSLGLLSHTDAGRALIASAVKRHTGDLALWRQVTIQSYRT